MRRRPVTLALLASYVAIVHASASCASPAAASRAALPVSATPRELDASEQVAQVLSRVTFGARPGEADRVRAMGVDRWIDAQLHPERLADSATDAFLAQYHTLSLSSAAIYEQFRLPRCCAPSRAGIPCSDPPARHWRTRYGCCSRRGARTSSWPS